VIHYRSVRALNQDICRWIPRLPDDIDVIVGVPRSGLLAGTLLALHMHKPLADVDGLVEGRLYRGGPRCPTEDARKFITSARRILVVDDSICTGRQLARVKAKMEAHVAGAQVLYGAVYAAPDAEPLVSSYHDVLPLPRVFEWNLFAGVHTKSFCVDLDGVLCRDPTEAENDDGRAYETFISTVAPQVIPREPVGWIVTSRLEKYRGLTEAWLARHGIRYNGLIMLDLPDKETRIRLRCHAAHKAQSFDRLPASLFVESSERQAVEIARRTGKDVLSMESREIVAPAPLGRSSGRVRRFLRRCATDPMELVRTAGRHIGARSPHPSESRAGLDRSRGVGLSS
jgi:orotate phosphoribosyltransferase